MVYYHRLHLFVKILFINKSLSVREYIHVLHFSVYQREFLLNIIFISRVCITEKIYHINTDLRHSPTEFMTSMLIHPSLSPYRIKHSSDPVALERQGTYKCLHI